MIRWAFLALLVMVSAARAEVARVVGGEHSDFTRVVVEAKDSADWRFGRTIDGYELALGAEVSAFDVTDAFEKIPRDRVTALWRDPDSGRLRLGLACACHAIAFEFRPGVIVIDIKSGPPPEGSAFEQELDSAKKEKTSAETEATGAAAEPDETTPAETMPAAVPPPFDWVEMLRDDGPSGLTHVQPLPLPTGDVSLDPLRDSLLSEISKGAAEGVVEIAEPGARPDPAEGAGGDNPWMRISVGEMPGLRAGDPRDAKDPLTSAGEVCLPDTRLDVASWGLEGPVVAQLGLGRSGMLTEFDAPVPQNVLRSARFHVFLSFGAEARQYLQFLDGAEPEEAGLLQAMAYIVDHEAPGDNPFQGMAACDTSAALWSTLAQIMAEDESDPGQVNANAVIRAFSALPVHMRRDFGPLLVDYFLARDDQEASRQLHAATLRAPGEAGSDVALMDARFQLANGEDHAATEIAENVLADTGPHSAEAAMTLVEAAFQGERQIDPGLAEVISAFILDARGTPQEAELRHALVLAWAMEGDFDAAFAALKDSPAAFAQLWDLAATPMPENLFLEQAVPSADDHPAVSEEVAFKVATRLADLGFAPQALAWLGPVDSRADGQRRLLAARAQFQMRDGLAVLELLLGLTSPEADALRTQAVLLLGDPIAAAAALDQAGDTEASARAVSWTKDWQLIAEKGSEPWKNAAALMTEGETATESPGPIARGTAMVEESAAARAAIDALLATVTEPVPSQ